MTARDMFWKSRKEFLRSIDSGKVVNLQKRE